MSTKIIYILLATIVLMIAIILFLMPTNEIHRKFSADLKLGLPFIEVYDVRETPLEMDIGHGHIGPGTLSLIKVDALTATSSDKTITELVTINSDESFFGNILFKEFDSVPVPTSGEYYLSFTSSNNPKQEEIKSNMFTIVSSAPYIRHFLVEPSTKNKTDSSSLKWNSVNTGECSITYLDSKSNKNILLKTNLSHEGILSVNPTQSTFYTIECTGNEIFKRDYPHAESWADNSKWLFVN